MKKLLIPLVLVAVVALAWAGIKALDYFKTPLVEYKIEGTTTGALVSFRNDDGEIEYHVGVTPPQSFTFSKFDGTELSISAKNETESGSVKVSIYYEGKLVGSHANAGPFAEASVAYTLTPASLQMSVPAS